MINICECLKVRILKIENKLNTLCLHDIFFYFFLIIDFFYMFNFYQAFISFKFSFN